MSRKLQMLLCLLCLAAAAGCAARNLFGNNGPADPRSKFEKELDSWSEAR